MKCTIHVYLLNELYSQEIAEKNHDGKESADNKKYLWEDELSINSQVVSVLEEENASYTLQGALSDGNTFCEEVRSMRVVKIQSENSPACEIGVSESILNALKIEKENNEIVISFFINDNEPFANPLPGIYISSKEFPKNLIF